MPFVPGAADRLSGPPCGPTAPLRVAGRPVRPL